MHLSAILAATFALAVASAKPTSSTHEPNSSAKCTTTIETVKTYNLSPITTIYLATHTATSYVKCNGCSLTIVGLGGHGPFRPSPTATLIDNNIAGTTTTTFACSPSHK
ncbi:hypothetical protein ABVK25_002932 [Lepraria finkii]|uniref:Uncharacterized protein n=1 Tax=Lepraria finkii TaxID=1340010 RepID=A0ABR4BG67_9LECA